MGKATELQVVTRIKAWVLERIGDITSLIPSQATSSNKLADKAFVNSSIATATATFRGSYNVVDDLGITYNATNSQVATALASEGVTGDNNDYVYILYPVSQDDVYNIKKIKRFKHNGTEWGFEYELNNSGFTAAQWEAINSGITSGKVTKLEGLPTGAELTAALNNRYTKTEVDAELADTPEFVEEDPSDTDLIDQYTQILQNLYQALIDAQTVTANAKADYVGDDYYVYHWDPTQGQYVKTNKYVKGAPGTTDYNDLTNKPTIPTKVSDLTNDSGFITSAAISNDVEYVEDNTDNFPF